MEYLNTGTFELDVSKLGILSVMQRALYNKVFDIDIFINKDKLTITSNDLSGNVLYLLREQDISEDNLINPRDSESSMDMSIYKEDLDVDNLDFSGFDNIFEEITEESKEIDIDKDIKLEPEQSLQWINDKNEGIIDNKVERKTDNIFNSNLNVKNENDNIKLGIKILESSINELERQEFIEKSFEEGKITQEQLDNSYENDYNEYEFDSDPVISDEKIKLEVGDEVCRFSSTINMLKSLAMFKKVTMDVREDEILLVSKEDMISISYPRNKSYADIEKYNDIIGQIEWEKFPANTVKSIIPLIDRIEDNKLRQKLAISKGNVFIYSDFIAVSANIRRTANDYVLNSDMLRLMKYSVSKWSNVYIGKYKNGLAFNIDGLIVVYPYIGIDLPINLVDLLEEDRKITEIEFNSKITKILGMVDSIGGDKVVSISLGTKLGKIETNRINSIIEFTSETPFKFNIDIRKMQLAFKLVGTKKPIVSFYLLKGNKLIIMFKNKDLKVIIEGMNFEYVK